MIEGLENLLYEEQLKMLGLWSLEKAQGDLIILLLYLKGSCKEESLISQVATWRRPGVMGANCTRTVLYVLYIQKIYFFFNNKNN